MFLLQQGTELWKYRRHLQLAPGNSSLVTPFPIAGAGSLCQFGTSQSGGGEFEDKLGIKE